MSQAAQYDAADVERAERVATAFNIAFVVILLTVVGYSIGQGYATLTGAGVNPRLAWALPLAVDVALAACLYAAAPLRKLGISVAGGVCAEIVLAFFSLALNCGGEVQVQHYVNSIYHAIPTGLLVTMTLVAGAYQKHYSRIVAGHRAQLDAAQAEARRARQAKLDDQARLDAQLAEAARQERLEEARLRAEADAAAELAAAERAEADRARYAAEEAAAKLESDRVRFAAQSAEAQARLEAERVRAEREAAKAARQSVPRPGLGPISLPGQSAPESAPPVRSESELLDAARLFFSTRRIESGRRPSKEDLRAHLRIAKLRANEIHDLIAAEEAARVDAPAES